MPFVTPKDVGTTPRGSLSAKRRLQVWERYKGTCVICDEPIDGVRDRWIVEHIRALELGGADDLANMGPAHERCGRIKTRDDHERTARAKRQKVRHLGAAAPTHRLPGARTDALKRKVDGTVVLRANGERPRARVHAKACSNGPVNPSRKRETASPQIDRRVDSCRPEPENGCRTQPIGPEVMDATNTTPTISDGSLPSATGEVLPALPRHLDFVFEERPLIPGEDSRSYDALLQTFIAEVKPGDVIEAIWVKDIVDLIWEAKRYRNWRKQILSESNFQAIATMMMPVLVAEGPDVFTADVEHCARAELLALGWLTGTPSEVFKVSEVLRKRGLTAAAVPAQSFRLSIPEMDRIERMIANADHRRDTLLREIERKRGSLGRHLRATSNDVIDVEPRKAEPAVAAQTAVA